MDAVTVHATLSMVTLTSDVTVLKFVPVIVTEVPPAVPPRTGVRLVIVGVLSYLYSTLDSKVTASVGPLTDTTTGQGSDVSVVTSVL